MRIGVRRTIIALTVGAGMVIAIAVRETAATDRSIAPATAAAKVRRAASTAGEPLASLRCVRNEDAHDNFLCIGETVSGQHFSAKAEIHADGRTQLARP